MPIMSTLPPKPQNETYRPELTHLPELRPGRRLARRLLQSVVRLVVRLCTHLQVVGWENLPHQGPLLLVSNHLGDADALVGLAVARVPYDMLGKVELYDLPVVGKLMDAYGTIWVHRGQPDRRAIRAALQGLAEGRMVAIAPEGRESVTGALEEATNGAAFLALKSDVPILPVVVTNTENWRIHGNLKRLRRTEVTVTIGPPFRLQPHENRHRAISEGTQTIMYTLARMLPPEYQGVFRNAAEIISDSIEEIAGE